MSSGGKERRGEEMEAKKGFTPPWNLIILVAIYGLSTLPQAKPILAAVSFFCTAVMPQWLMVLLIGYSVPAYMVFLGWKSRGINPLYYSMGAVCIFVLCASLTSENRTSRIYELELFTPAECDWIVQETQRVTSVEGWTTVRHRYHPTEDIPVADVPTVANFINDLLDERLRPFIEHRYQGVWDPFDMFIVRYSMERQRALDVHIDLGHVSFDIALSDPSDFSGGGVWYRGLDEKKLITPKGVGLVHPAMLQHAGLEITSGTRYVLVGFSRINPAKALYQDVAGTLQRSLRLWGLLSNGVAVIPTPLPWNSRRDKQPEL